MGLTTWCAAPSTAQAQLLPPAFRRTFCLCEGLGGEEAAHVISGDGAGRSGRRRREGLRIAEPTQKHVEVASMTLKRAVGAVPRQGNSGVVPRRRPWRREMRHSTSWALA